MQSRYMSLYKKGILHFLQIYNIHKGSKCYKPFTTFELHTSCESKKIPSHIIVIVSIAKFHKNECTHMYAICTYVISRIHTKVCLYYMLNLIGSNFNHVFFVVKKGIKNILTTFCHSQCFYMKLQPSISTSFILL